MPLNVEVIGEPLAGLKGRMQTSIAILRQQALAAWRSVIRDEFNRRAWNRPSGGFFPWKQTEPFGTDTQGGGSLRKSGRLFNALMGQDSASIERDIPEGVEFGVNGAILPYAAVHRGGGGKVLSAEAAEMFQIPVTPKMRGYLGAVKGVHLRKDTKFIQIPRRPYATANPEVRTRIAALMAAHLAGREAPARLTA